MSANCTCSFRLPVPTQRHQVPVSGLCFRSPGNPEPRSFLASHTPEEHFLAVQFSFVMYRSASHGLQALRWSARTSAARRTYSQTVTAGQTTSSLSSKMRFAAMPFLSGILVAAVYDKYWPGEKTGKLPSATGLLPTAHAAEKPSGTEVPKPWALRNGNYAEDFKQAIEELQAIFPGDKIATADEDLTSHGVSPNTHHKASKNPACVFYPESTEDVSKAVKIANRYRMPVIPFSGGTSLEGHTTTPYGGMCVDFCRMNNILEIRGEFTLCDIRARIEWVLIALYLQRATVNTEDTVVSIA